MNRRNNPDINKQEVEKPTVIQLVLVITTVIFLMSIESLTDILFKWIGI